MVNDSISFVQRAGVIGLRHIMTSRYDITLRPARFTTGRPGAWGGLVFLIQWRWGTSLRDSGAEGWAGHKRKPGKTRHRKLNQTSSSHSQSKAQKYWSLRSLEKKNTPKPENMLQSYIFLMTQPITPPHLYFNNLVGLGRERTNNTRYRKMFKVISKCSTLSKIKPVFFLHCVIFCTNRSFSWVRI